MTQWWKLYPDRCILAGCGTVAICIVGNFLLFGT